MSKLLRWHGEITYFESSVNFVICKKYVGHQFCGEWNMKRIYSTLFMIVGVLLFCSSFDLHGLRAKRPCRILFVLDKFPWYTKMIIVNQINMLIEHGHDVRIYSRTTKQSDHVEPEIEKYNLIGRTTYETLPADLNYFDVIICQYGTEGKLLVPILKERNYQGKLVTCIRGGDITSKIETVSHAYDQLFERGDLFLPVCGYFKYRLVSLGCNESKIKVLHSGIDCSKFKFRERNGLYDKKIRIVSVGRVSEDKGMKYVIQAVGKLVGRYPNIEYLIIGDGKKTEEFTQLVSRYGIKKNVKMLGWCSQDQIRDILDTSDLFVLPSVTAERGAQEGIPNAVKEAMVSGMPVISTYHSGIPELIQDGVNGFLVPERDGSSLMRRIEYLINNPHLWAELGRNARHTIQTKFENKMVNSQLLDIVDSLY